MGKQLKEIWKVIGECPNYSVSNLGRVKHNGTGHIKNSRVHKGYKHVTLHIGNKRIYRRVNRLVAIAFLDNPESKPAVNHIDGNKLNNVVTNLEWVTTKENNEHAWRTGLQTVRKGFKNPNAFGKSIKRTKVRIVETGELFESVKSCADSINGNSNKIFECLNPNIKRHTHRGYHFERID